MRKLHVQLKRMYDQSNTEEATDLGITQQFKEDINNIYCQSSTMCREVERQIKQLMDDVKKEININKEQLQQVKQENLSLKSELSKRGKYMQYVKFLL